MDLTYVLKARNDAARAVRQFNNDLKKSGKSVDDIRKEAKGAARETDKLADQAKRAGENFKRASGQTALLSKGLRGLGGVLGGIVAGFASFQVIGQATTRALEFNRALAETATLIEGTPQQLDQITKAASEFTKQFGGTATEQVRGFYQAISAGATDLADATEQVRVANQLATAGVTDVATAIDIISTAVNSYGSEVLSATEASDSLFTAVRLGKTTVPELARALGRVVPIAKSAGVNFDELNATVATLTSLGIGTAEAVTGVRGVLAAIIRPTAEAEKAAERLGVSFSTAGIAAAGGLVPFLEDLIEKTGGSSEELSQFFSGVEGLTPVLALAGGGLQTLSDNMETFGQKTGATEIALAKVEKQLSDRFDDATASLLEDLRRIGDILLQVVVPATEAAAAAFDFLVDNIDVLIAAVGAFAALTGIRLTLALAGLVTSLSGPAGVIVAVKSLTVAIGFLSLAMRTIPFVAVVAGIVAVSREFRGSQEAFAAYKAGIEGVTSALETFKNRAKDFAAEGTEATREAARNAALTAKKIVEEQIAAAQKALDEAKFRPFGIETPFEFKEPANEARAALSNLQAKLAEIEAVIEGTSLNTEQFNAALAELSDLSRNINLSPLGDFGLDVDKISPFIDALKLGEQVTADFQEKLRDIRNSDTFLQAAEKAKVFQNLIVASVGDYRNLTKEQRDLVDLLIAAEAEARALARANKEAGAEAVKLVDTIAKLPGSLNGASGAAILLATQMGTTADEAERYLRALDAAAGIQSAPVEQQGLTFGPGTGSVGDPSLGDATVGFGPTGNGRRRVTPLPTLDTGGSRGGGGGGARDSQLERTVAQLNQRYTELRETVGLTSDQIEEYRIRQQLLQAAQADGVELNEEIVRGVLAQRDAFIEAERAADTFARGAAQGYQDFVDSVRTNSEVARDIVGTTIRGFTSAFQEFFRTGKFGWRDLLADILSQIAGFLANRLVIDFLGVSGGGTGGKGTVDLLKGIGSAIIGGFRAYGGPVTASTPYIVGERGPEVFVPRTTGTVYPNEALSDFGQNAAPRNINVTMNIVTQDANSFRRSQGQIEARMYQALAVADERNN